MNNNYCDFRDIFSVLTFLMIAVLSAGAQDILLLKNGDEIEVKLIEISSDEIAYHKFGQSDGPLYRLSKTELVMIRYENGEKEMIAASVPSVANASNDKAENNKDMRMQGKKDASVHYKGKNSGAGWTAATTIIFSPLLGLIPAFAFTANEPGDRNLNAPNMDLMEDYYYNRAYIEEAHTKKKRKVWSGFGIGSGIWLLLLFLL